MGLDRIWNLDLDLDLLRFHLLLLQDCTFLHFVSFYLGCMHARAHARARPLSGPFPPHPTIVLSVLASHPYLYSRRHHRTLHYLPLPLPFLRPFISRHPSAFAKPVPKDSSRAAVTYFTFSFSFFCFISIMLQGKVAYIVTYILVKGIFFRCVQLVLICGIRIVHSGTLIWRCGLVSIQDQCCHRDPTVS